MTRPLALALAIVLLPTALGRALPWLTATLAHEEHVCVCPLDADGDCLCPDCIRLDVHGAHDGDHEDPERPARGPIVTSGCAPTPAGTPAIPHDPALAPDPQVLPPAPAIRVAIDAPGGVAPEGPWPARLERPPRTGRSARA